jgi:predicted DNA-binding transcriptional regulator YafY
MTRGTRHDYSQTVRIFKIVDGFRKGRKYTQLELAEEHGVNKRTIERDLAVIQSELHIPLVYEREENQVVWRLFK